MEFDVFLSYNSRDRSPVRRIGEALKQRGLTVWLDVWELEPGRPWQEALEVIVKTAKSAAVLVGADGIGPWQNREMRACLSEFVKRDLPVIPVLLPGVPRRPELPLLLGQMTWVDLRAGIADAGLDVLCWGITGVKPDTLDPRHESLPERSPGRDGQAARPWRTLLKRVKADAVDFLADADGPRLEIIRHRVSRVGDEAGTLIPAGTDLLAWHEDNGGELLLLGAPGSGKTTALFELALAAVDHAMGDPEAPLPVVLELSRWRGGKEESFGDWIGEQVAARYRIRRKLVAAGKCERELLLLLDGFDQVERRHQPGCLRAIAHYCQASGPVAIVITSRIAELAAALATGIELDFKSKIVLRPLSGAQARGFLDACGPPLETVQRAIDTDRNVAQLARTPLWLGLMNKAPAALQDAGELASLDQLRTRILDACIEQRLESRKQGKQRFAGRDSERRLRRLRWLARTMAARGLDDLYLEDLQPGWLGSIGERWRYVLATRTGAGLLLAAAWCEPRLLPLGLLGGAGVGLIDGARLECSAAGADVPGGHPARIALYAVAVGGGLLLSLAAVEAQIASLVVLALTVGLFFSWQGRRPVSAEIRTFTLSWQWVGVEIGMLPGLRLLALAAVLWVMSAPAERTFTEILIRFVAPPLVVFGAALGGFRHRRLEEKVGWRPDLAIKQTIRSALLMLGLASAVALPFATALFGDLLFALPAALPLVTLVVLMYGGYDVLRHFVLRLVLAAEGRLPLALVAFLDHASHLVLMRRVGRGYTFFHRILRDRLAMRSDPAPAATSPERSG